MTADRPSHPAAQAWLLIAGVLVGLVLLAILSTYGS